MSLRLHGSNGTLERNKVKMLFARAGDAAIEVHPGVCLKPVRHFPRADPQISRDAAPLQEPPEHQRPFETVGTNWQVACCGCRHPPDDPSRLRTRLPVCSRGRRGRLRGPFGDCFPAAKACKPQAQPGEAERCRRFEYSNTLEAAQAPKSPPDFHCRFQPPASHKVAAASDGPGLVKLCPCRTARATKKSPAEISLRQRPAPRSIPRRAFSPAIQADPARNGRLPRRTHPAGHRAARPRFSARATASTRARRRGLVHNRRYFSGSGWLTLLPKDTKFVRWPPQPLIERREVRPFFPVLLG